MGLTDHTATPNGRSAGQAPLLLARKLCKRLRPYRWLFAVAIVQVVLIGALELLKPWPLKLVVDHVLTGHPVSWLWLQTLAPQTLLLLGCVMGSSARNDTVGEIRKVSNSILNMAFGSLGSQRYAYLQILAYGVEIHPQQIRQQYL